MDVPPSQTTSWMCDMLNCIMILDYQCDSCRSDYVVGVGGGGGRESKCPVFTRPNHTLLTLEAWRNQMVQEIQTNLKWLQKVAPMHAMNAYCGSIGLTPRILDLDTRWWVVSFTLRLHYPSGKSPWCQLNKRMVGPPQPAWTFSKTDNLLLLPKLEPPT
jgi:hypothetical protein